MRELAACQAFYGAAFEVLKNPLGGTCADFFRADEVFVSTAPVGRAQGLSGAGKKATGRAGQDAPSGGASRSTR